MDEGRGGGVTQSGFVDALVSRRLVCLNSQSWKGCHDPVPGRRQVLRPSLLFNAHRKQNRPTPGFITRACRDPSQGRARELGPPRFGKASSALKRQLAQACSLRFSKRGGEQKSREVKLFPKLE